MKEKNSSIALIIVLGITLLIGYILGQRNSETPICKRQKPVISKIIPHEGATIRFQKLEGDTLYVLIEGNGRLIVHDSKILESEGQHQISMAQIPTSNSLEFTDFPYVGNQKTHKFYNADSYWARGTEEKYRRFFQTKEEATAAGFIGVKNLK